MPREATSLLPPFARPASRVAIRRVGIRNVASYQPDLAAMMYETLREFDPPVRDKVVFLKPNLDPEKSPGGIIIPDMARSKLGEGDVRAVGPGKVLESGKFRETEVKRQTKT